MKFTGMEDFQITCRLELKRWFDNHRSTQIAYNNTYVVWSCKTLQNYKCLCSTNIDGDSTYAEFTYNGDKGELYMDAYTKEANIVVS